MSKGPLALRTISEAAETLGVPQHVLRFWETKFPFIRPTKRAGGRRFYRAQDMALLEGVKILLHDRGYTIRGVQMLFKDLGQKAILSAKDAPADEAEMILTEVMSPATSNDQMPHDIRPQGLSDQSRAALMQVVRMLEDTQGSIRKTLGI
jgi:DNA-binding transcriptional MerR regulator